MYLEQVFAENLLVNLLTLHIAGRLAGERARLWRYLLAAALGGLWAAAVLLPPCWVLDTLPGKAALSLIMAVLAWRWRGWLPLLRRWGALVGVTLVGGGAALAAATLLAAYHPFGRSVAVGADALLLTALGTGSMALFSAGAIRRRGAAATYAVRVWLGGKPLRLQAMLDTGNQLREPVSGLPVLIVEGALRGRIHGRGAVEIPFGTVGGQACLTAVPVDKVLVRRAGRWHDAGAMYVAAGMGGLGARAEALLPSAALE